MSPLPLRRATLGNALPRKIIWYNKKERGIFKTLLFLCGTRVWQSEAGGSDAWKQHQNGPVKHRQSSGKGLSVGVWEIVVGKWGWHCIIRYNVIFNLCKGHVNSHLGKCFSNPLVWTQTVLYLRIFFFVSLCVRVHFIQWLPAKSTRKNEKAYFYLTRVDRSLSIFRGILF